MNGKDEGLVATGDNEYDEEIKKKRMMRIIIFFRNTFWFIEI